MNDPSWKKSFSSSQSVESSTSLLISKLVTEIENFSVSSASARRYMTLGMGSVCEAALFNPQNFCAMLPFPTCVSCFGPAQ